MKDIGEEKSLSGDIYDIDDFTFYKKVGDKRTEEALKYHCRPKLDEKPGFFSCEGRIPIKDNDERVAWGRVLGCRSFKDKFWSLSFRKEPEKHIRKMKTKSALKVKEYELHVPEENSTYAPKETLKGKVNTVRDICDILYKEIFPTQNRQYTGVVIVTGRTGSAKSQVTRRLIYRYLQDRIKYLIDKQKKPTARKERRPHLVTFEDPIEEYYFKDKNPLKNQERGLDYTPRQKDTDVADLTSAIIDAKRQTPTVFFVGEIREREDWEELIEFAGTGHLLFTTAHAGSLTEAMGSIFGATQTRTPAQRSVIADRILALIHLKLGVIGDRSIIIPAVWLCTASGAKTLMAEGRASLIPHNPTSDDPKNQPSSIGRRWFAEKLIELAKGRLGVKEKETILTKAIKWDLEGI